MGKDNPFFGTNLREPRNGYHGSDNALLRPAGVAVEEEEAEGPSPVHTAATPLLQHHRHSKR